MHCFGAINNAQLLAGSPARATGILLGVALLRILLGVALLGVLLGIPLLLAAPASDVHGRRARGLNSAGSEQRTQQPVVNADGDRIVAVDAFRAGHADKIADMGPRSVGLRADIDVVIAVVFGSSDFDCEAHAILLVFYFLVTFKDRISKRGAVRHTFFLRSSQGIALCGSAALRAGAFGAIVWPSARRALPKQWFLAKSKRRRI